jgi:hypothetical protein
VGGSPSPSSYVCSFVAGGRAGFQADSSSSDDEDFGPGDGDGDAAPAEEPPADEGTLPEGELPPPEAAALPRGFCLDCVRAARPPPPDLSAFELLEPVSAPVVPLDECVRRCESAVEQKAREVESACAARTQALEAQFNVLEAKCAALETSLRCYAKVAAAAPRSPLEQVIERRSLADLAAFIEANDPDAAFAPPPVAPRQLAVLLELLCKFARHERYDAVAARWMIAALSEIDARGAEAQRHAEPAILTAAQAFGGGDSVASRMVFHLARSLTIARA